jgi:hypothetical protein
MAAFAKGWAKKAFGSGAERAWSMDARAWRLGMRLFLACPTLPAAPAPR